MKKSYLLFFTLLFFFEITNAQNVGINPSGVAPDASAMLDIVASDRGLLVPRFALSDVTVAAPVVSPAVSLIVYNTATAGVSPNNVVPGFYYWDGAKWVAFSGSGGREWALLGNAGTVAGTNFLGTTDNVDLQFRVNNIQGGKINIAGSQTYFGYQAGLVTTGTGNSFYGSQSGIANAGGTHNTAVGYLTFTTSTTGSFNTTVGYGSMRSNLSGSNNTFLGTNAGANWSTTSNNTGVGMFALQGTSSGTGVGNTAVGYGAGSGATGPNNLATTNGSYNSFLGYNAALNGSAFTNATAIGANALAGASNVMVLGGVNGTNGATATTSVGIGLIVPTTILEAFSSSGDAIFGHSSNVGGYLGRETNITFGTPVQTLLGAGVYAANPSSGYTSTYAQSTGLADVAANINFSNVWIASYNYVENTSNTLNAPAIYAQLNNSSTSLTGVQAAMRGYSTRGTAAGATGITAGGNFTSISQNQPSYAVYGTGFSNVNRAGGYFESFNYASAAQAYAYVGANIGGVQYKIGGIGNVAEFVPTANHGRVKLTCPESPEYWYQDYGTVELVNGKAHVNLDPILADIIIVDEQNPIRVFCTPVDMLYYNGVAIVNKTTTGFDIVEINGGTHSGKIDYQIVVKPKTNFGEGRFPQAPGPAWLHADKEPASAKARNQTAGKEIFNWPADWEVYGYDVEKEIGIGDVVPAGPNKGKFKVAEGVFMDQMPAKQPKK